MKSSSRDELVKLRWIGSTTTGIGVLITLMIMLIIFFCARINIMLPGKEKAFRKELYHIEYPDSLTQAVSMKDFDGKEIVVKQAVWMATKSSKYTSLGWSQAKLENVNVAKKSKLEVIKIYDSELRKNGWIYTKDFQYKKENMKLTINFIYSNLDSETMWKIAIENE